jgi:hypothetical protein
LRDRYDGLDALMSRRLLELSEDIRQLPDFMRKLKIIMIPSVGYFTFASKMDKPYFDFIQQSLQDESLMNVCDKDEDKLLEMLLGEDLKRLGWKFCFQSETDIYLQNRVTADLDENQGDLYSMIQELEFYLVSII